MSLTRFFRRRYWDQERARELDAYLEAEMEENIARGLSPEEARYAARRKLGNTSHIREEIYRMNTLGWLETLVQDLRFAARMLRNNAGFTAVAVVMLALGIGANTAIFSLVDAVMLRLLPVQKPEELVLLEWHDPIRGDDDSRFSNPLWEQLRGRQDVFSGVFASGWGAEEFDLAQGGPVQPVNGLYTSGSYFRTLGVRPAVGLLIDPADDRPGCPDVAVLSYAFWQSHFGGRRSAVGKILSLNRHSFQIIGVSASGFYGIEIGYKFDVVVPICAAPFINVHRQLDQRSGRWLKVIGRVKPGLNREQLNARLAVLSPQVIAGALPDDWTQEDRRDALRKVLVSTPAATGLPDFRGQLKGPLYILMAVVGLVLIIACANIASLFLVRAANRRREIAVRRALGASRVRLVRQMLVECVLLSSVGALTGALFARWGANLLVRGLSTMQHQVFLDLSIDSRVLGFTAALSLLTALLFGMFPALRSTHVSLTAAMKGSDAVEGSWRKRFSAGRSIVSMQVGLSLVVLVAASILMRSFEKLATLDLGFDPTKVLLVKANLQGSGVPPGQRPQTYNEIEKRLRALPGVICASRSSITPISDVAWTGPIHPDSPVALTGHDMVALFNAISPAYSRTLRIPLLAGRNFNDLDDKSARKVAIVDQKFVRRFYPKVDPIGKYFRTDDRPGQLGPPIQIVGVLMNSNYFSVRDLAWPAVFLPIAQLPLYVDDGNENFELRTATPPAALAHLVERTIAGVNNGISLEFRTLTQQVSDSIVHERLLAMLSGFFAILGLILAAVGLYGSLAYMVTQRQKEFGIRMALGAKTEAILRIVMRDVGLMLGVGIAAGIVVSLITTPFLQSLLFGLGPRDPLTLVGAAVVLSGVAFVAGLIPARRATKVDPLLALRYE